MLDARSLINETARAVAFLSRLSVPGRFFVGHDGSLSKTVAAFPLAGLVITLPSAILLDLLATIEAAPMIAALLAIALQIAITGALHEDGLCDTADGLGGGRDREKALSIMKDSRIGTYGALALILSVALRVTALAQLLTHLSPLATALIWLSAATLSRTALVWHWSALPPARPSGVAAQAGAPDETAGRTALALGAVLTGLLCAFVTPLAIWLSAFALAGVSVALFTAQVRKRIQGHTGDTIGASQQISELAFLVTLAILL